VEDLRIEAAERLLESTDLTVGAIARLIGYRHAETLHRVVLRRLRMTPESYRRHARADAARTPLPAASSAG
jgi:AraC-like DNA-binding protein